MFRVEDGRSPYSPRPFGTRNWPRSIRNRPRRIKRKSRCIPRAKALSLRAIRTHPPSEPHLSPLTAHLPPFTFQLSTLPCHAPLPHPHLQRAPRRGRGQDRPPLRLGLPQARPRRHPLPRPARPLRPHAGRRPSEPSVLPGGDGPPARERRHGDRPGRRARRERDQPRHRHRQGRARRGRVRRRERRGPDPDLPRGRRLGRRRRGPAPQVPLPRPAPRVAAQEHRAALEGDLLPPPPHGGPRLPRVPDADPHVEFPRGRARLPRPEPHPPRRILRAAAGAADLQAAADGRRLRPLLPDRAVLPRRATSSP